jgi:hypothetical protein
MEEKIQPPEAVSTEHGNGYANLRRTHGSNSYFRYAVWKQIV